MILQIPLIITFSIAETTKKSIKYPHKDFADYLSNEISNTIFLQPTDKEEIANIISSLNSNKVPGPNIYIIENYFFSKMTFQEIDRFIQPLFHCKNCKTSSCF